jgi:hypothetical protein
MGVGSRFQGIDDAEPVAVLQVHVQHHEVEAFGLEPGDGLVA